MPIEMLQQQLQDAQMMLLEFIALYVSLAACAGFIIWLAGIVYLSYREVRDARRVPPVVPNAVATSTSSQHCLINHAPLSVRSKAL